MDLTSFIAAAAATVAIGNGTMDLPAPASMGQLKDRSGAVVKAIEADAARGGGKVLAVFSKNSFFGATDEWAVVTVPTDEAIPAAAFRLNRDAIARTFEATSDKRRTEDRVAQLLSAADIDTTGNFELGVVATTDRYVANVTVVRFPGLAADVAPLKAMVVVTSLISLRHRLVALSVYRSLKTSADIVKARERSVAWAEDVAKASW